MKILTLLTGLVLTGCASLPQYCNDSESSIAKSVGLTVIEIGFGIAGVSIDTQKGICTEYYNRREPANGYREMRRRENPTNPKSLP